MIVIAFQSSPIRSLPDRPLAFFFLFAFAAITMLQFESWFVGKHYKAPSTSDAYQRRVNLEPGGEARLYFRYRPAEPNRI